MSNRIVQGVVAADVADGATLTVAYPAGTSKGNFQFGVDNAITIGQNTYKAPGKATFVYGAASVVITNKTGATWKAGLPYIAQMDMPGTESGQLMTGGKRAPRVVPVPLRYLDLGSPAALSAGGLRAAAPVAAGGAITPLLQTALDVPRNITLALGASEVGRTFTITSLDALGNTVVETIAGAAAGTITGKKAHSSNIVVSVDAACAGNISIGWGNVLGLPLYVGGAQMILKELQDGAAAAAGTLVVGDQTQPSGTTGDVRGTYVPAVAPDGTKAYALIVMCLDPGYPGADQFTG